MSIAVRTNLSCRPWELVHFWRARTFWPVLTLGQTVKGLMFEGLGLVLWVNVRNGFRFSLGLRLRFGIMLCPHKDRSTNMVVAYLGTEMQLCV